LLPICGTGFPTRRYAVPVKYKSQDGKRLFRFGTLSGLAKRHDYVGGMICIKK
jgi:hypothetical protein